MTTVASNLAEPVVCVLGPVRVGGPDGPVVAGRQGVCLALLAVQANDTIGRGQLIEALYPSDVDRPEQDLHVVLSRLRRRLRERCNDVGIDSVRDGYRLTVPRQLVDACRFEDLSELARSLALVEPDTAEQRLAEALALWHGPVFAGLDLATHPAAVRLEELRLLALERRFELVIDLGRHRNAVAELLALCRRTPHREQLWALAMRALHRSGRTGDALALYQEARRALREELGLDPGAVLVGAEREVLGIGAGVPAANPAPAGGAGPELIGRAADLATLAAAVEAHRTVTVTGPGGVGKTALVRRFVHDQRSVAVVCELSVLDRGASIEHALAASLGVRLPPDREPRAGLVATLRGRTGLLVLDNCEHVVDGVRQFVGALGETPGGMRVVATSRVPLGLADEQLLPLRPLAADAAVALFAARAARADPTSAGAFGRESVAALCAELDGLPLAIELAAARVRLLTPQEMLERRAERIDVLRRTGDRDGRGHDERAHSLEASLRWSWEMLSPQAQALLEVVSVLAGSFDWNSVIDLVRVVGEHRQRLSLRALAELVDASMLMTDRCDGRTRYRLLFTVRDFAVDRAREDGRLVVAERAHAAVTAEALARIVEGLTGPDEAAALDELDVRWADVRIAVQRSVEHGWTDLAVGLVAPLSFECQLRERFEVGQWAGQVLGLPHIDDHPRAAEVLGTAAIGDWVRARFAAGASRADRGIALWQAGRCAISGSLAIAWLLNAGVGDGADPDTAEALAAELRGDERLRFWLIWFQGSRALLRSYEGDRQAAGHLIAEMAELVRTQRNDLARCMLGLCEAVHALDRDPAWAAGVAAETSEVARRIRATWFVGPLANYRAAALIAAGELDGALDEIECAVTRVRAGGAVQSVANTARNLVVLAHRLGVTVGISPLAHWLGGRPVSIAGTPGMRRSADAVVAALLATAGPRGGQGGGAGDHRPGGNLDLDGVLAELVRLTVQLRGLGGGQREVGGR